MNREESRGVARVSPRALLGAAAVTLMLGACASSTPPAESRPSATATAAAASPERQGYLPLDDYFVVNCVLPGQVRRFGQVTQVTKPRPARLEAYLCRLRGGQYIEFDRADMATSIRVWEDLAASGDAEAQLMVGRLYERGDGGQADLALAAQWYQRGAEAGSSPAKLALASLYERGRGVPRDMDRAMALYREALGLSAGEELVRRSVEDAEEVRRTAELQATRDEAVRLQQRVRTLEQNIARAQAESARLRLELEKLRSQPAGSQSGAADSRRTEQELARVDKDLEALQGERRLILNAPSPTPVEAPPVRRLITNAPSPEMVPIQVADALVSEVDFGRFFALVVTVDRGGINYASLSQSLGDVLRRRYGFEVTELRNPTGARLFATVTELRERMRQEDNLLVFHAGESRAQAGGRGSLLGYWQVADSTADFRTWVPHDQFSEHLSLLPVRRVLLLTSGSFDNGLARVPLPAGMAGGLDRQKLSTLLSRRARIVISGGLVTSALSQLLEQNANVIDAPALWTLLSQRAQNDELPELGQLQPDSEGGQFFMVPRDLSAKAFARRNESALAAK